MSFLGKEYTFQRHENFDVFLKVVGVPEEKIPAICSFQSKQKLDKNGDSYTAFMVHAGGSQETTFTSGVEFDDTIGPEKTPIKTKYVVDGNTVTQTIASDKGEAVFKKEYNGDELVVTITAKGWDGVAKRYYKA